MEGEVGSNPSSPSFKEGVQSPGIHVVPSRHCSSSGGSSGVQTGFGKKCLHLFFFFFISSFHFFFVEKTSCCFSYIRPGVWGPLNFE
jgi:hypothetical protein